MWRFLSVNADRAADKRRHDYFVCLMMIINVAKFVCQAKEKYYSKAAENATGCPAKCAGGHQHQHAKPGHSQPETATLDKYRRDLVTCPIVHKTEQKSGRTGNMFCPSHE